MYSTLLSARLLLDVDGKTDISDDATFVIFPLRLATELGLSAWFEAMTAWRKLSESLQEENEEENALYFCSK